MLGIINKLLWGLATAMLLGSGLYFTFKLRFIQFKFKDMIKALGENNKDKKGITSIESLAIALGARVGVGSLAGVALSIYLGGVGTIFWMWISGIISSTNAFAESVLGVRYRVNDGPHIYKGGPSYYIEKGLNKKWLARLYAVIIIFAYIFGFLTIQANTIVKSITESININPVIIAITIIFLTLFIIMKGVKSIARVSSKLVPFKIISYFLISLFIVLMHIDKIPSIFSAIISSAFNIKAMGFGFITPLIIGIQRGIFSNEAGIGSGAIASATANTDSPSKQGLIQIFGVYITTIIICTMTALVIISSNYQELVFNNVNGIEITQGAFQYHTGSFGEYIVMAAVILFTFSTIISGYYYGESSLKFLYKNIGSKMITIFKVFVIALLFIGSLISATVIWSIVDIFVVFMAIINIYALLMLRKDVVDEYQYYKSKKYDIIKHR